MVSIFRFKRHPTRQVLSGWRRFVVLIVCLMFTGRTIATENLPACLSFAIKLEQDVSNIRWLLETIDRDLFKGEFSEDYFREIESGRTRIFFVYLGIKAVGFIAISSKKGVLDRKLTHTIDYINVRPEYRKIHVARHLLAGTLAQLEPGKVSADVWAKEGIPEVLLDFESKGDMRKIEYKNENPDFDYIAKVLLWAGFRPSHSIAFGEITFSREWHTGDELKLDRTNYEDGGPVTSKALANSLYRSEADSEQVEIIKMFTRYLHGLRYFNVEMRTPMAMIKDVYLKKAIALRGDQREITDREIRIATDSYQAILNYRRIYKITD